MALGWGIIGAGYWADTWVAPALVASKKSRLVAVMNRSLEKAGRFAQRHGASRYYDTAAALVSDKDVDAIYISSPPYLHAEHTILAAAYGKHVLCEKPMAMNLDECERMVEACQKNQVKLMIGFALRFQPCHRKAKELVAGGFLGQVELAIFRLMQRLPDNIRTWRLQPQFAGGGVVMDVAGHGVDLLRFVLGDEVVAVTAMTDANRRGPLHDMTGSVLLEFASGAHGVLLLTYDTPYIAPSQPYVGPALQLHGTAGSIYASDSITPELGGRVIAVSASGQAEYEPPRESIWIAETDHLVDCVVSGQEPLTNGQEGMRALAIVLAAYESERTGGKVCL